MPFNLTGKKNRRFNNLNKLKIKKTQIKKKFLIKYEADLNYRFCKYR